MIQVEGWHRALNEKTRIFKVFFLSSNILGNSKARHVQCPGVEIVVCVFCGCLGLGALFRAVLQEPRTSALLSGVRPHQVFSGRARFYRDLWVLGVFGCP